MRDDGAVFGRLTSRKEWQFFAALRRAAPGLAIVWWSLLVLRGVLTAALSLGFGWLGSAIQGGRSLSGPLTFVGAAFTLSLVLHPIQQYVSTSVGSRLAAHLYDRLMTACVSPTGIAHLEQPEFTTDLAQHMLTQQGAVTKLLGERLRPLGIYHRYASSPPFYYYLFVARFEIYIDNIWKTMRS